MQTNRNNTLNYDSVENIVIADNRNKSEYILLGALFLVWIGIVIVNSALIYIFVSRNILSLKTIGVPLLIILSILVWIILWWLRIRNKRIVTDGTYLFFFNRFGQKKVWVLKDIDKIDTLTLYHKCNVTICCHSNQNSGIRNTTIQLSQYEKEKLISYFDQMSGSCVSSSMMGMMGEIKL